MKYIDVLVIFHYVFSGAYDGMCFSCLNKDSTLAEALASSPLRVPARKLQSQLLQVSLLLVHAQRQPCFNVLLFLSDQMLSLLGTATGVIGYMW